MYARRVLDSLSAYWPHLVAAADVVLGLVCTGHVLLTKRDPRAAGLWIGLVWLAPVAGLLLYVLIGINRMSRRAVRRALVSRQSAVLREFIVEGVPSRSDEPLVVGNAITPLRGGDLAYPEMIAAIENASDTILMSTYIFDNDRAGKQFCAAFAAAVKRGVEVRVIIDAVGLRYSIPSILSPLRQAGVQVARFSRTVLPWRLRYANLRNHRKIMVIDGCIGFTGGMNIREECLLSLQPDSPTHDLHFRVEGPVIAELQRVLVEDWEFCTGESLPTARFFPPLHACGEVKARAIPDGPDRVQDPILWTRMASLARARQRVRIVTPYFVPEPSMIAALGMVVSVGTRVDILLPADNNLRMVKWASTSLLEQVLELGCHVYMVRGAFDHSKLMLVDDHVVQVGSANWDARSFRLNFEFDLECYDTPLAAQLHELFEKKRAESDPLSLEDLRARGRLVRLRDGFAALLAPYL